MATRIPALVVGGGQAGLATSYFLRQRRIDHVVLEARRLGESWRSQRWASFRLNTPGWANGLPGLTFPGDPDGFGTVDNLVTYFDTYRRTFDLPVRTSVAVTNLAPTAGGGFLVQTEDETYDAAHVVIASGVQNSPRVPAIADTLAPSIKHLHAADYVDPPSLPGGRILVVGGAQTGCQITEDLLAAGREVLLSTGRVPRVPRRYRGRDIVDWLVRCGFFAQRADQLPDPMMARIPQPQVSGVDGGRTISYQQLARDGARLLGHLRGLDGTRATFADDLADNVRFADEASERIRALIDRYIEEARIDAPTADRDPADAAAAPGDIPDAATTLDLAAEQVGCVIWCTGFTGEFGWLPPAALDPGTALPRRDADGIVMPGVYIVGFPWVPRRESGIILGAARDAERIAEVITTRLSART